MKRHRYAALPTAVLIPFLLGINPATPAAGAEVADQFSCPACHVNRLREFKKQDVPTLVPYEPTQVEPTGRQNVVSTPGMCLSCHDGFVLDSRAIWAGGHTAHPLGVAPSSRIAVPPSGVEPEFPLNEDGHVYCGSCHSAHAGEGAAADPPPFMRLSSESGQLCQGCHVEQGRMAGSVHGRVRGAGKPGAAADFAKGGLCSRCHRPHDAQGPALWARAPGQGNTAVDGLCRSCHREDGGATLPERTDHPREVNAWSQALRGPLRSKSSVEMPVFDPSGHQADIGQIACATCHDVHGLPEDADSTPSRKLLRLDDTTEFLCADCHAQRSLLLYRFFHSPSARRR